MGVWQIIWIAWIGLALGFELAMHGKSDTRHHNFWTTLFGMIAINAMLFFGGFYG